jgi:hypothetical protein
MCIVTEKKIKSLYGEEETTSDAYAVMYLAQYCTMSSNEDILLRDLIWI